MQSYGQGRAYCCHILVSVRLVGPKHEIAPAEALVNMEGCGYSSSTDCGVRRRGCVTRTGHMPTVDDDEDLLAGRALPSAPLAG